MMENNSVNEEWGSDFMEFIEAAPADPPIAVSDEIRKAVARDLRPLIWKVFMKFGAIQSAVAFITLLICPQFEVGFGILRHDDAHLRALLGEIGYMTLCGAIFLSSGATLAAIILRSEELRAIKKIEYLYLFLTSILAIMVFRQLGSPTVFASYAAWFAGAFGGSILGFEMIKRLRFAGLGIGPAEI